MSEAKLHLAFSELARHAESMASSALIQPDGFLVFQHKLRNLEAAFAMAYDGLSAQEKSTFREVIHEFQALKERAFMVRPEVVSQRIKELALPEAERSTTEDLLREEEKTFAPTVGDKLRVPSGGFGDIPPQRWMLIAAALMLVVSMILVFSIASREKRNLRPEEESQEQDDASKNSAGRSETQDQSPSKEREQVALYRHQIDLAERQIRSLRPNLFVALSLRAQIEALDDAFSNQAHGIDVLEDILQRAAAPVATWKEANAPHALAEFIAREASLTAYREHQAILPSEVFASLGGEPLPLGISYLYTINRLGLEASKLAQVSQQQSVAYWPILKDGSTFGVGGETGSGSQVIGAHEVMRTILTLLAKREISELDTELPALFALLPRFLPAEEVESLQDEYLLELTGRAELLPSYYKKIHASLLAEMPTDKLSDTSFASLMEIFGNQPPLTWLQAANQREIELILPDGRSTFEALALALKRDGSQDRSLLIDLLLKASSARPSRITELSATLASLGVSDPKQEIARFRATQQQASAEAIYAYVQELAKSKQDQLLLAVLLELLGTPERMAKPRQMAMQAVVTAHRLSAWPEADRALQYAESQWPQDAVFHRLSAEVEFGRGNTREAVAILKRYIRRWPQDASAAARLEEIDHP